MGDPKFARKRFTTPSHPWEGARIAEENLIIKKYGLKNKRELWKTETRLRDLRHQARELLARLRVNDPQAIIEKDALINRLTRLGLLSGKADLNDVLALEVEALLARRLQTQIYLKGLARSVKQARQLIVHGHIAISGRKVTVPSYLVTDTETGAIDYYLSSPFVSDMHPERPAADFQPEMTTVKEERRIAEEREREIRRSRELDRIAAIKASLEADEDVGDEEEDSDVTEVDVEEQEESNGAEEPSDSKTPKGEKEPKEPKKDESKGPEGKPSKASDKDTKGGEG